MKAESTRILSSGVKIIHAPPYTLGVYKDKRAWARCADGDTYYRYRGEDLVIARLIEGTYTRKEDCDIQFKKKAIKPALKPRFQVGDEVTVRKDLKISRYYTNEAGPFERMGNDGTRVYVLSEMAMMAGQRTEIVSVNAIGYYIKGSFRNWAGTMFEEGKK